MNQNQCNIQKCRMLITVCHVFHRKIKFHNLNNVAIYLFNQEPVFVVVELFKETFEK